MRKTDKHKREREKRAYDLAARADLVRVLAGRDQGRIFLRVGAVDSGNSLICDGKAFLLDQPKKKNVKHLQSLAAVDPVLWQEIIARRSAGTADAAVRKLIKQWHRERTNHG